MQAMSLWHDTWKELNGDRASLSQSSFPPLCRVAPRSHFPIHFTDESHQQHRTNIYGFKCLRSFSCFSLFLPPFFRCLLSSSCDAFKVLCCFSVRTYQTPLVSNGLPVMRTWLFKFPWNFISSRAERLVVLCKYLKRSLDMAPLGVISNIAKLSSRLFLLNFHEAKLRLETLLAELAKSFSHESFIENVKQQRKRKAMTKRELSAAHFTFQHYHHHSKTRSDHIEKL